MKKFVLDTDLYWSLPGPRKLIARVSEYAEKSRIIWVNLPLDLMPGTWEGVKKGLNNAHIGSVTDLIIRGGTDIAADIGVHFDRSRVTAEQLAGMVVDQPTAVILRSIGDDAKANCERYAQDFMEAISSEQGNTSLLIGINEKDLIVDSHNDGIQVVVFDGSLTSDEMDAYVALRMLERPGPGSTNLTRMIISEFAGADVDFAERMMELDEARIINIKSHLPMLMGEDIDRWRTQSWLHRTESVANPEMPHVLHDCYLADHAVSTVKKIEAKKRIEKRYWLACVKAMTPWLEERRLKTILHFDDQLNKIAKQYDGKIPRPQGKERDGSDRIVFSDKDETEYNNIVGMCIKGILSVETKSQQNALSVCKTAKVIRDNIAHLRMPNPEDILEIIRKMDSMDN